jgi:DNA-binding NtrC family response regulator
MSRSVLVVDDDEAARTGLVELLKAAGYEASGAGGFEEATRALDATAPDILVADVRLAAFNGLHLLHRCRMTHPRLRSIVISGFRDKAIEREATLAGAVAFLLKPLVTAEFLELVARTLESTRI